MRKTTWLAAAALALTAGAVAARPGDNAHPIPLKMGMDTDTITVRGVMSQTHECCAYTFKAQAGQKLYLTENGAMMRVQLDDAESDDIDAAFDESITLPRTSTYTLTVSPDLMAEGAFGQFQLTVRIMPLSP